MWVPRLGRIVGTSASECSSSGRIRSAHTPVALTTLSAATTNSAPLSPSRTLTPAVRSSSFGELDHLEAVRADRAEPLGLREHRQHEARVVGLAVVEQVSTGRLTRRERRQQRDDLLAGDHAMTLGAPVGVAVGAVLRRCPPRAAPAPQPRRRHHVVHVEPDPDEQVRPRPLERRHHERQRPDQVRRQLDQQPALEQRLADEPEVEVLEIAQAAVDEFRGAAAGPRRVVGLLHQRDAEPARGGVERDPGAGDPAADHDHVEALGGKRLDARSRASIAGQTTRR